MSDPTPWIVATDTGAARKHAPATLLNREPIADVLTELLPQTGEILEIASGSGEHCAFLAARFPNLHWHPSDSDATALTSIASWCEGLLNVATPLSIDAAVAPWPVDTADAILCINMTHISAWAATEGLMREAGRILPVGAPLILYGPYRQAGVPTAPSNEAFDASLKARNPQWGLREVADIDAVAAVHRLEAAAPIEMPANNVMLTYRRAD